MLGVLTKQASHPRGGLACSLQYRGRVQPEVASLVVASLPVAPSPVVPSLVVPSVAGVSGVLSVPPPVSAGASGGAESGVTSGGVVGTSTALSCGPPSPGRAPSPASEGGPASLLITSWQMGATVLSIGGRFVM